MRFNIPDLSRIYILLIVCTLVCSAAQSITLDRNVEFTQFFQSVPEKDSAVLVSLMVSIPDSLPIEVQVILKVSSTVQNNLDLEFDNPLTVVIPAYTDSLFYFEITILEDSLIEADELIMLAISEVSDNAVVGPESEHVIEIVDNDSCTIPRFLNADSTVCLNDEALVLTAHPSGGDFGGTGVLNDRFYPNIAGIGRHLVSYTTEGQCASQIQMTLLVENCISGISNSNLDLGIHVRAENNLIYVASDNDNLSTYRCTLYSLHGRKLPFKRSESGGVIRFKPQHKFQGQPLIIEISQGQFSFSKVITLLSSE